jgi:hypothetical protein
MIVKTGGSIASMTIEAESETLRYAKGEADTVIKIAVINKYGKFYGTWSVIKPKVGSFIPLEDQQNPFEEVS